MCLRKIAGRRNTNGDVLPKKKLTSRTSTDPSTKFNRAKTRRLTSPRKSGIQHQGQRKRLNLLRPSIYDGATVVRDDGPKSKVYVIQLAREPQADLQGGSIIVPLGGGCVGIHRMRRC